MEQKNIALLVGAFVSLIIGVMLVSTIAGQTNEVTKKVTAIESYNLWSNGCWNVTYSQVNGTDDADCNLTLQNIPTGWRANDCPIEEIVVADELEVAFVLNTDYYLFNDEIVQMLNTSRTNGTALGPLNTTNIRYDYCNEDYLNSSFGRSITDIIAGFFAIALLVISVGLFYQVLKNEGLTNI